MTHGNDINSNIDIESDLQHKSENKHTYTIHALYRDATNRIIALGELEYHPILEGAQR